MERAPFFSSAAVKFVTHSGREEHAIGVIVDLLTLRRAPATSENEDSSDVRELASLEAIAESSHAVTAANRSILRAPSLHNLLKSNPNPVRPDVTTASVGDSEVRSRCQSFTVLLLHLAFAADDKISRSWNLKHNVVESINELFGDLDDYHSQVAEQALEHIHEKIEAEFYSPEGYSTSMTTMLMRVLWYPNTQCEKRTSIHTSQYFVGGAVMYRSYPMAMEKLLLSNLVGFILTPAFSLLAIGSLEGALFYSLSLSPK